MTSETVISILATGGFTAFGGAFLIKVFVESGIKNVVKLNFDKQLESYKTTLSTELEGLKSSLKNSEVYFELQLKALTELRALYRKFLPRKTHPDMEWDEACREIADKFPAHADSLLGYLCGHEAVLPEVVREKVEQAHHMASEGRFEYSWDSKIEAALPTEEGERIANRLNDVLVEAIKSFQSILENKIGLQQRS